MSDDDHDHDHDDHDHDDHEGHDHGHELPPLTQEQHRAEGVALFNHVWELLETPDRSAELDDQMVHAAHASRWHWGQAGDAAGAEQLAVGEWQCARVYAMVGRGEPALHHAQACLAICEQAGLADWVVAAAYEALTRAWAVAGDIPAAREWLGRARIAVRREVAPAITEPVLALPRSPQK